MADSPTFEERSEQVYVGKPAVMPMSDFEKRLPAMFEEVSTWLGEQGQKPSGPNFLRYHAINMPERMDVDAAFPVGKAIVGDGSMSSGRLPAGGYGVLAFTGVENGTPANARLIDWIAEQGRKIDSS